MTESQLDYGMRIHVDLPYDKAVERATAALKEQGFGVLTEIDVKSTLRTKLDVSFRRYVILGACNPPLAHRALRKELEVGLLLPCNVIIYEDESGDGSTISIVNPAVMLSLGVDPEIRQVADEATTRLRLVLTNLEAQQHLPDA